MNDIDNLAVSMHSWEYMWISLIHYQGSVTVYCTCVCNRNYDCIYTDICLNVNHAERNETMNKSNQYTIHCCAKEVEASVLRGMILLSECLARLCSKYDLDVWLSTSLIWHYWKNRLHSSKNWWVGQLGMLSVRLFSEAGPLKVEKQGLGNSWVRSVHCKQTYRYVPRPLEDWS